MTYCNSDVLVGNWVEEKQTKESEQMMFLLKRKRNELLLQRSRNLFKNLLKQRIPKLCGAFARFGFQVQLIATQMPGKKVGDSIRYGLALSGLVSERQVDFVESLADGCMCTFSPITTACCRNTFTIVSDEPNNSKEGKLLEYGEHFLLQIADYSDQVGPGLFAKYIYEPIPTDKNLISLRLSALKDMYCRFAIYPDNPNTAYKLLGQPVPINQKVIVRNCAADKNLYVNYDVWFPTFFGPECGVKVETSLDQFKRFQPNNIFILKSEEDRN